MSLEQPEYSGVSDAALLAREDRTLETVELEWRSHQGPWVLELGSARGVSTIALHPGGRVAVGSGRGAGLRLYDDAVSSRHCLIEAGEGGIEVSDLGSKNGLFVGGARVRAARLPASGASFVIGRTSVTIRPESADDSLSGGESVPGLVGSSAPMRRVARDLRRHARLRAPVLLLGESGTGKDVAARCLHTLSLRSGSYVPLNAGAISESLADAELFGHQRGAFTGAVAARQGAFENAHRGTLFLDEVAELSSALQVKLLRVVEDGCVRPLGSAQPMVVDARLVSATWAPLEERVRQGRFRADLYHRLSTVVIRLPPLRERRSDIPSVSEALLARFRDELGPRTLASSALARLVAHEWPGNVRELASVLYRAAVNSDAVEIAAHHLDLTSSEASPGRRSALSPDEAQQLLRTHRGNASAAARSLGVARSTFRAWLERG
jgi:DNA-binding NtrC family response regulator